MLKKLRESIEQRLFERKVSLIMMFNKGGVILWHKGRMIEGSFIDEDRGYSKTSCLKAIKEGEVRGSEEEIIRFSGDGLSKTAIMLMIKSIMILPIDGERFFYVDSVEKEFSKEDEIIIKESCYYLKECIRESDKYIERLSSIKTIRDSIRKKIFNFGKDGKNPILLTGETGVGKGYISRIIHEVSKRGGKYVNVNVSSLPEQLFESELFGYKKGAFTGAEKDKGGLIEEAEGGTLFLDEIGDLGFDSQTKILKVIEEGKYMRLGDTKERSCDVRFVFSTNKDLLRLVREKKFREDLYYRISVFHIHVPPLRERDGVIDELIRESEEILNGKKFSKEAMKFIRKYEWRGNIREFLGMIKRVSIMSDKEKIGVVDVVESMENHLNKKELKEIIEELGHEEKCKEIYNRLKEASEEESGDESYGKVNNIIREIEKGKSFWDCVWNGFIEREIDRDVIKSIINKYYKKSGMSYKKMLNKINIEEKDYHKFMSLLHKYKLLNKS